MSEPSTPRIGEPARAEPSSRRPPPMESDLRHTFERIVSDLLRKGIDAGRGSFERMGESVSPKEIAATLLGQIGDLRSGIVRAVAQEVGIFLREANIAAEIRNILDGLGVDAKIELRYKHDPDKHDPDDGNKPLRKPRARVQRP